MLTRNADLGWWFGLVRINSWADGGYELTWLVRYFEYLIKYPRLTNTLDPVRPYLPLVV
jgi:hypothetical protein